VLQLDILSVLPAAQLAFSEYFAIAAYTVTKYQLYCTCCPLQCCSFNPCMLSPCLLLISTLKGAALDSVATSARQSLMLSAFKHPLASSGHQPNLGLTTWRAAGHRPSCSSRAAQLSLLCRTYTDAAAGSSQQAPLQLQPDVLLNNSQAAADAAADASASQQGEVAGTSVAQAANLLPRSVQQFSSPQQMFAVQRANRLAGTTAAQSSSSMYYQSGSGYQVPIMQQYNSLQQQQPLQVNSYVQQQQQRVPLQQQQVPMQQQQVPMQQQQMLLQQQQYQPWHGQAQQAYPGMPVNAYAPPTTVAAAATAPVMQQRPRPRPRRSNTSGTVSQSPAAAWQGTPQQQWQMQPAQQQHQQQSMLQQQQQQEQPQQQQLPSAALAGNVTVRGIVNHITYEGERGFQIARLKVLFCCCTSLFSSTVAEVHQNSAVAQLGFSVPLSFKCQSRLQHVTAIQACRYHAHTYISPCRALLLMLPGSSAAPAVAANHVVFFIIDEILTG
jgi:hypothetical protein